MRTLILVPFVLKGANIASEERREHLVFTRGQQVRPERAAEGVDGGGAEPCPAVGRAVHRDLGQDAGARRQGKHRHFHLNKNLIL